MLRNTISLLQTLIVLTACATMPDAQDNREMPKIVGLPTPPRLENYLSEDYPNDPDSHRRYLDALNLYIKRINNEIFTVVVTQNLDYPINEEKRECVIMPMPDALEIPKLPNLNPNDVMVLTDQLLSYIEMVQILIEQHNKTLEQFKLLQTYACEGTIENL